MTLPTVVAHADWSFGPKKRWIASAQLDRVSRTYSVSAPKPVGDASSLLRRLNAGAAGGSVLVGFDFPIGIPKAYADIAGAKSFTALLPELGLGQWANFYDVAELASEISPQRPFFPRRPGGTSHADLLHGLGASSMNELLRICEKRTVDRKQACSLFWTLGGNQVGKAAISGWRDVLAPALRDSSFQLALWPFDGTIDELLENRQIVATETYPTEFYRHLGITLTGSKRAHSQRAAQARAFRAWRNESEIKDRVAFDESAREAIDGGFGSGEGGEDPFDAFVGLLGMLNVLLGRRSAGWLEPAASRAVEGWIFGQAASPVSLGLNPPSEGTQLDAAVVAGVPGRAHPSTLGAKPVPSRARRARAVGDPDAMTNIPDTQATDGVPTYLGGGDPAGRFADYYPAWVEKMAGDVTLEGSLLDGAVQGADAVRAVIGGVRQLYDRQDFIFAGPWGDNGFIEDYNAEVHGRPVGCFHLITFNADGQAQHIAAHYRPLSSVMFFSRLLRERLAGTPYAERFLAGEA